MESRVEKAVGLFNCGYNCAQSVAGVYADPFGDNAADVLKIATPFGGGMAGMRHVCGAVNGMVLIAGLYNGTTVAGREERKANYDLVKTVTGEFEAEFGSIICRELLSMQPPRPCVHRVRACAGLIEKYMCDKI